MSFLFDNYTLFICNKYKVQVAYALNSVYM